MDNKVPENVLLKEKEECEKAAQEAFNSILAAYRLVINEIGDDTFKEINEIICKQKAKKRLEGAENAFREYLYALIKEKFTKIWKNREMDLNVGMLELAKRHYVTENPWRPTGKSVQEQIRPHYGRMLLKERDFLRKQIEEQNEKIAKLIPCIEEYRRTFKAEMQEMKNVSIEIEKDTLRMEESSKEVDKKIEELTEMNEN